MAKTRFLLPVAALALLTACNPLSFDPQVSYPGFEVGRATVTGTDPMWLEARVAGAADHPIYALAAVRQPDVQGPTARSCDQAGETVPCEVVLGDVRQPGQTVLEDGGAWLPLMTLWPDETVEIWLVCIDPVTNDLSCPDSLRLELRTVDDEGTLAGDLSVES